VAHTYAKPYVVCGQKRIYTASQEPHTYIYVHIRRMSHIRNLRTYGFAHPYQYVCFTCAGTLVAGNMPKFAVQNGMRFPMQNHSLKSLTDLEASLVAIHIPFMTMFTRKTQGGQWAQHGAMVNVPSDNYSVQIVLPRLLSDANVVTINLKRKLSYKPHTCTGACAQAS
jgi:hypothetical protein